ncbi:UNVERIFIED_CONTAM: hypothetical protein FKN15_005060, partial [Acipenser sinensis]
KLLKRTQARRENLQKKMADRPTAAARPVAKRTREPLAETNKQPLQPAEEVQPSTKPSPSKKRYSDNKEVPAFGVENRPPDSLPEPSEMASKPPEALVSSVSTITKSVAAIEKMGDNGVKCTSPGSTSVKSRLQKLAEQRRYLDNDGPTLESAHLSPVRSQKKVPSPPRQTAIAASSETPVGRKGRLANLAATVGSWEDDANHPSGKKNNAQELPGTTCLSKQFTTNGASACASSSNVKPHTISYFQKTTEASVNEPILSAQQGSVHLPVKSTQVFSPSPKKTEIPKLQSESGRLAKLQSGQNTAHSPQKNKAPKAHSPFQSGRVLSPSPKNTEVKALQATKAASTLLQTREELTKETHVQQQEKDPSSIPGGTGIKSFLERFGERCQERTTQNPPSSTLGQRTTTVTPNTKTVQERLLKAKQLTTTTADLTRQKRQEREIELASIRNLFQKGNMSACDKKDESLDIKPLQTKKVSHLLPNRRIFLVEAFFLICFFINLYVESCLNGKPVGFLTNVQTSPSLCKDEVVCEIELNVDEEINSSGVIDDLFDGVLEEEQEQSKKSPKRETRLFEEEDNDELNISSMSLPTPLAETVNAVVTSPEISVPTSTALELGEPLDKSRPIRFQRAQVPHAESADRIESILNNDINMQQTVIHQASQALNCCTDVDHGKGSQVEAEAERLLLVATERRVALLAELNKLKNEGPSGQKASSTVKAQDSSASKGSIALSEIRLPLKANFICSAASKPDAANYYFFIMIRAGAENTVATPLVSTQNALCGDAISFPTKFTLPDVSSDFEIDMEVYSLVPFLSPLAGHIYLKLECQVGSSIEERGFLNPAGRINLSNCTSSKIDPANREFCARPNTFELITVRPQREGDRETLVSQCMNTMWVTKNWLSADTKEECNLWMQKLNQVLIDLHMWQPGTCYRPL